GGPARPHRTPPPAASCAPPPPPRVPPATSPPPAGWGGPRTRRSTGGGGGDLPGWPRSRSRAARSRRADTASTNTHSLAHRRSLTRALVHSRVSLDRITRSRAARSLSPPWILPAAPPIHRYDEPRPRMGQHPRRLAGAARH